VHLIGYDRAIDSMLPVPGAIEAKPGAREAASLSIRLLEAGSEPPSEPLYRLDGQILRFAPPGVGSYRCSRDEIAIAPEAAADMRNVTALLLATALPAAMWMSGATILHAAAVRLPGQDNALAFAGPSGIGKSTLAAGLVERGADLIGDDTLCIRARDGAPLASGLPGGWFAARPGSPLRHFHSSRSTVRRCPLGAIVILSEKALPGPPERLPPVAAIEQLLANRHRPRIPRLLGIEAAVLQFCSFLAHRVPLYILQRAPEPRAIEQWALDGPASSAGE